MQVLHREAADPGEKQRGRPLPGTSVRHRPSSGAADSQMSGKTLQGWQVRPGQVQLQLPGKLSQYWVRVTRERERERDCKISGESFKKRLTLMINLREAKDGKFL